MIFCFSNAVIAIGIVTNKNRVDFVRIRLTIFCIFCYVCFDLLLIRQIKAVREFSIISASKKLLIF